MKLSDYWQNLSRNERLSLLIGSGLLIAILIYLCLIAPLLTAISALSDKIDANRATLSWLQPANDLITRYHNAGYHFTAPLTGTLTDQIDKSLQLYQLNHYPLHITVVNDQQLQITFNSIPFDPAIEWLTALWLNTGIQIKQALITPLKTPGLVSMQLTLGMTE